MQSLMVRLVLVLILLTGGGMFGLSWLGMSPTNLGANIAVGTGISAKLACSGRYLSGFDEVQIRQDLATYSAAVELFSITLDDVEKRASVDLMGFWRTSASYRKGLGCTLDFDQSQMLDKLSLPAAPLPDANAPWPKGTRAPEPSAKLVETLTKTMALDQVEGLNTRALMVIQNGQILAEVYAPEITKDTPLMGWSMGKSLTALMLGWLERQGEMAVTEDSLFKSWAEDERRSIQIKDLLQMSSGLAFSEVYTPGSDATRMLFMQPRAANVPLQNPLEHPSGSHFSYSSGTTNLLSLLFTQRVGGPQQAIDHLYEDILWPLGMLRTTLEPDATGVFMGSSNIYASTRDWARLAEAFLNRGELNGYRVAGINYMDRAIVPNDSDNAPAYGYQVWLNRGGKQLRWPALPEDAFAFEGNRGQVVMIIPSLQTIMLRLGWSAANYPSNRRFANWLAAASS